MEEVCGSRVAGAEGAGTEGAELPLCWPRAPSESSSVARRVVETERLGGCVDSTWGTSKGLYVQGVFF